MKYLFSDNKKLEAFIMELKSWSGTPYRHFKAEKGIGADCGLYIAQSLKTVGILKNVTYDYYPRGWFIFTTAEAVIDNIRDHISKDLQSGIVLEMKDYIRQQLFPGDIVAMSNTPMKVINHLAVVIGKNLIIHSHCKYGVTIENFDQYETQCKKIFTLCLEDKT